MHYLIVQVVVQNDKLAPTKKILIIYYTQKYFVYTVLTLLIRVNSYICV